MNHAEIITFSLPQLREGEKVALLRQVPAPSGKRPWKARADWCHFKRDDSGLGSDWAPLRYRRAFGVIVQENAKGAQRNRFAHL